MGERGLFGVPAGWFCFVFNVNLTQARIIQEEGSSVYKDWAVGKPIVSIFLTGEGQFIVGEATPGLGVLGFIRKLSKP